MSTNRKMSISQLSKIVGFSPSTVSRVLSDKPGNVPISEKTQKIIKDACKKYGYRPNIHASRFFSKRARNIGLLIPESTILSDRNLARFLDGAYTELANRNYRLSILSLSEQFLQERQYLDIFESGEVDGLVIWGARDDDRYIDELDYNNRPFILGGNRYRNYPNVHCDDFSGIKMITEHCIKHGARRLAYVSITDFDAGRQREAGFRAATEECERLIIPSDNTIQDISESQIEELCAFSPDAIVSVSDAIAIKVINRLRVQIGADAVRKIMFTGGDNSEFSSLVTPALTTFDQLAEDVGKNCVQILTDHLDRKTPLKSTVIPVSLIIRDSA